MELILMAAALIAGCVIGRLTKTEEKDLQLIDEQNKNARLLIEVNRLRDELQQSEDALVEASRRMIEFQMEAA